jgi:hypothetical protein
MLIGNYISAAAGGRLAAKRDMARTGRPNNQQAASHTASRNRLACELQSKCSMLAGMTHPACCNAL